MPSTSTNRMIVTERPTRPDSFDSIEGKRAPLIGHVFSALRHCVHLSIGRFLFGWLFVTSTRKLPPPALRADETAIMSDPQAPILLKIPVHPRILLRHCR